jgi:hypothetical protein
LRFDGWTGIATTPVSALLVHEHQRKLLALFGEAHAEVAVISSRN